MEVTFAARAECLTVGAVGGGAICGRVKIGSIHLVLPDARHQYHQFLLVKELSACHHPDDSYDEHHRVAAVPATYAAPAVEPAYYGALDCSARPPSAVGDLADHLLESDRGWRMEGGARILFEAW